MSLSVSQTAEESISLFAVFGNWKTPSPREGYSIDHLIDAYLIGKERGKTEEKRILADIFAKNFERAKRFSEEKFHALKTVFGVSPLGMKMRVGSISSFEILFILSKDDFESSKIESIYSYLIDETTKANSSDFNWTFVLMPSLGELNEEAIALDGYSLTYASPIRV